MFNYRQIYSFSLLTITNERGKSIPKQPKRADIRAIILKGRHTPPQANQFLRAAKKKSPKGLDGSQETCYIMSCAKVAQSVEHSTENAGVAGSIPALGTS
jgi:hypothetical protein